MKTLEELCRKYRYELVVDTDPGAREDALGRPLPFSRAQLCKGRIIAVKEISIDDVYAISHEIAHGLVGFCDEKDVALEQASILAEWLKAVMKEVG